MYYRYYCHPSEHTVNKHYGVRTDRYKLIFFHDLHEWELFDLQKDPHELFSVYNDPTYASIVKDLKKEMEHLRKELGDHDQWVDKPPRSVTKLEKL
jgi:arylsulfatase A-like enzyme